MTTEAMSLPEPKPSMFFTTRWTLVSEAASGGDTEASDALSQLCHTYWQPLYRYIRRTGKNQQDAEDIIQGFFTQILQHNSLRLADRDRGRFRSFLLGSLKNHMAKEWQREHRLKRGGFATQLSIDWQDGESGLSFEPTDERSPDKLFDRDWAITMLDKVLDELASDEKDPDFDRWKPYLSMQSGKLPYADIAGHFGITEGAARVTVHRLRKRYRQQIRDEIARTLAHDQDVDDEMRALFTALSE